MLLLDKFKSCESFSIAFQTLISGAVVEQLDFLRISEIEE